MPRTSAKYYVIGICAVLVSATLLVYWQACTFDFVNYDDDVYVYQNPYFPDGLTWQGVTWALTTGYASFWHPVTWLSLMLDRQMYGPGPAGYHFTNVLLHLANTLLLFFVFRQMTGRIWPSAFVAAAFALHPMHVESVAWIAERKDVLSTFFMLLALAAYVGYVRRPSAVRYAATVVLFALSLMAKPMFITLPFVMLLLDYWPLYRLGAPRQLDASDRPAPRTLYALMVEKVPFFILSFVFVGITLMTQQRAGGLLNTTAVPLGTRVANAAVSYVTYIAGMFWPMKLSPHYPFNATDPVQVWPLLLCVLVLLGISFLAFRFRRDIRYLAVGWLWFLGTLLPVIGLVQFTGSSHADRFTYVSYTGLFVILVWGLSDLTGTSRERRNLLTVSGMVALTAMGLAAHRQAAYWRNSIVLFSHAIEVTKDNYLAYSNRGNAYYALGRLPEAIADLNRAIKIKPDHTQAYNSRGSAYKDLGRWPEAMSDFARAVELRPAFVEARYNLAGGLKAMGRLDEAAAQYRAALTSRPDWPDPMNNLAWLIAANPELSKRNTDEAIRLAERACDLTYRKNPAILDTLSVAYASAGRFNEAMDTANKALALAADKPQLKDAIQNHLQLYKQGKPVVDSAAPEIAR